VKPSLPPLPPLDPADRQKAFDTSQFVARARQQFETAQATIDLRKWAAEQAVKLCSAVAWQDHDKALTALEDCMSMIYTFASAPMTTALDNLDDKTS
jgi:hypothetical protein